RARCRGGVWRNGAHPADALLHRQRGHDRVGGPAPPAARRVRPAVTQRGSPSRIVRRAEYAHAPHVHVIEADALRIDYAALLGVGEPAVVVANLPYNIATAILAALLDRPECFSRLLLMLQPEVVDRLRAAPGSKDYSALSVYTQFAARLRPGIRVGPAAFVPRPKVESEVIVIEPYLTPPVAVTDLALFKRVVRTTFSQRRKQLLNSLRPLCHEAAALLRSANIEPSRRPETLTLAEFATM